MERPGETYMFHTFEIYGSHVYEKKNHIPIMIKTNNIKKFMANEN